MSGLIALQSKQHLQLLDEIDKLRAVGLQEIVSLPQLVVCGDQSSGKSSVLEAITEVPFPRKETLCTRFATEIVLRRAATQKVAVSIVPDASRPMVEADALRRFDGKLKDLDDLPRVAEEATQAMGINQSGNAFSKDVLSIEISGPDRPQLTLVDLPGLIHSENKAQTTHDVELVWQLVSSYIENKRTIILAVVTAKNDYANQIILKRAREVDRDGNRTLGIITKPDTLHPGSESEAEFVDLAQNEDSVVQFRLGWHILKNRSYEVKDCSFSERNRSESSFFDEGAWSKLSKDVVGVDSLRRRLSALLLDHIRSELPSVCREVKEKLLKCEKDLKSMGDERSSSRDQGIFLSRLGQRFSELCKAAVDGLYEDAFFGNTSAHPGNDKRLRAAVQNANMTFATHMRLKGHTREVVRSGTEESVLSQTQQNDMPLRVTEAWAVARIQSILEQNRGRELPGTFNPTIIHTLFLEQSERWGSEARKHVKHVWAKCTSLVQLIVAEIANKRIGDRLMHYRINDILKKRLRDAEDELEEILRDRKRHAITYNHYYIDNVQKIHEQRRAKSSERALRKALGLTDESKLDMSKPLNISPQQLLTAMSTETEADMDRFACIEILDCMLAYYEVALKNFIDNVAIQVIERRLVARLWEVFTPGGVASMSPNLTAKIASESPQDQERRKQLTSRAAKLKEGLDVCREALSGFNHGHQMEDGQSLGMSLFSDEEPTNDERRSPSPVPVIFGTMSSSALSNPTSNPSQPAGIPMQPWQPIFKSPLAGEPPAKPLTTLFSEIPSRKFKKMKGV